MDDDQDRNGRLSDPPPLRRKGPEVGHRLTVGQQPHPPWRAPRPEIDARVLLRGGREAALTLDGETYRLRITSNNKLILTK